MIALLVCNCANSEIIARRVLEEAGLEDWALYPCFTGKDEAQRFLRGFGRCRDLRGGMDLFDYLSNPNVNTYAVVVGYNDEKSAWEDVGDGKLSHKIMGKAIAKAFA